MKKLMILIGMMILFMGEKASVKPGIPIYYRDTLTSGMVITVRHLDIPQERITELDSLHLQRLKSQYYQWELALR